MDIRTVTTTDQFKLHIAYQPPASPDGYVLLCTHGVNSSFYTTPLLVIAQLLQADGHGYAVVNNRGHDWMTVEPGVGGRWLGSAYERFEDSVLDLQAAADWLVQQGHSRIVLAGHSLGALKVGYMQARAPHPAVLAMAMCSGPSLKPEYAIDEFEASVEQAQRLVRESRGSELMMAGAPADRPSVRGPFSAATYANKYAPEANTRVLRYVTEIKVPSLFFAGSKEPAFVRHAQALHEALQRTSPSTFEVIEGAEHSYAGFEDTVANLFRRWFRTFSS